MPRHRNVPPAMFILLLVLLCLFLLAFYSLILSRSAVSSSPADLRFRPLNLSASFNHVIREDTHLLTHRTRLVTSIPGSLDSFSVLLPNWEVLVLVYDETPQTSTPADGGLYCLFPRNETSPANFSGVLPFSGALTFKCLLPNRNRRLDPFRQPVLARLPDKDPNVTPASPVLPRWDFLAYECFSTETDVVVFVKGVNSRQGINKSPEEFSCVFGDDINNAVRTAVTSSKQEVFRCHHPKTASSAAERTKVSIEIQSDQKLLVPSVAYYTPPSTPLRTPSNPKPKSLLCATTMVHNVAKFLREWVMYYSGIGVDKFILYDNDSDDDLERLIEELNEGDYNIERIFWVWPKTQEAGFSHSAVYFKDSCSWMMYVDVDEFVFSPSWLNNSSRPSKTMLKSLISTASDQSTGQVSIKCNDFGPSEQKIHPETGVIQGYNCRRQAEERHKSIILLDAVNHSLLNVIHHFDLNDSYYNSKVLPPEAAVINHYKFQAWPEFTTKFRRRVSAFVADWRTNVNPTSKDRTPGLGFQPIKPDRWEQMFCDVRDERLKLLTRKWFGSETPEGFKMAWQL
ncbi:hypothetical protein GQ457_13G000130 [Hibiscus cannabinus]